MDLLLLNTNEKVLDNNGSRGILIKAIDVASAGNIPANHYFLLD